MINLWTASHNSAYTHNCPPANSPATYPQMPKDTLQSSRQRQLFTFPFRMCTGCQTNTEFHSKVSMPTRRLGPGKEIPEKKPLQTQRCQVLWNSLVQTATTEYYTPGGLNTEAGKLKAPADLVSGEDPHSDTQMAISLLCPHMMERGEGALWILFFFFFASF